MRPPRPCLDCGKITDATRCPECRSRKQKIRDAARYPDRQGHSNTHTKERRRWKPHVDTGTWPCSRCGETIQPGTPWDVDNRPWGYEPSHASCNRAAGARREA